MKVDPLNEVDNIILSMLAFVDFSDSVSPDPAGMPAKLKDCLEAVLAKYPSGEKFGQIIPDDTNTLFCLAAQSKRFADTYVSSYRTLTDEKSATQFAATTFVLPDDTVFIAFRGTDDSLAGWREDFRLSYDYPVQSQILAAEYTNEIARHFRGNIILGGHSKGGNLALYAAAFADSDVKSRIKKAFSNDGPGFPDDIINSPQFKESEHIMLTILPQSSSVGMLMSQPRSTAVISSTSKSGIKQHDPFSWTVLGKSFIHLAALSPAGKKHQEMFSQWINSLSLDRRRTFTEAVFGILDSTGVKTVSDLSSDQIPKLAAAAKAVMNLSKGDRDMLGEFLKGILEILLE